MPFRFKHFAVDDTHCALKVGTDAVTLGASVKLPQEPCSVLDIGTGCGILALMIAQRYPHAQITAIEIDSDAAGDAERNFSGTSISLICDDVMTHKFSQKFDLLISNPPFFSETLHSPDKKVELARHGNNFNLLTLISLSTCLLNPTGTLAFIAPFTSKPQIDAQLALSRLKLYRQIDVSPVEGKAPIRMVCQSSRAAFPFQHHSLIIGSEPYQELTKDFYL